MRLTRRIRAWNASLDDPVDLRSLVPLRVALGPIVVLHLRPFLTDALGGTIYRDRFTLPVWEWYPHLPRSLYVALLWGLVVTAVMLSIGALTRLAAWATALGVAYNVGLSQTHFHHNRAFLIILLVGVAVLPVGRTVSIDAWRARRRGSPLSPHGGTRLALTVLRIEVAAVYLASGFSKLIDGDWWGGSVTRLRVVQHQDRLESIPDWIIDILSDPSFHAVAAKVIVLTELFIGAGLLIKRTRWAAVWVAIPFHVAIQFTAAVQVFSVAALAALVIWIDRPVGQRSAFLTPGWNRFVAGFDWTGRFTRHQDGSIRLIDAERTAERRSALVEILSLLPVTFWFALPVRRLFRR